MKQLVLPVALSDGQQYPLSGSDYHYLAHVLRVHAGSELTAVDSQGRLHLMEVESIASGVITLRQTERLGSVGGSVRIHVYQAVPKGRRFDDIVRNLTQLGVQSITPIVTERSVADPSEKAHTKTARWNRVAREAVQQSGASPVVVHAPQVLREIGMRAGRGVSLLLHPDPLANRTLHEYLCNAPNEILLWVGPEGGFADNEIQWLRERGAAPLWLGPRTLRSELAAVVAASAIQTLLLEQSAWRLTTEQEL